MPTKALSCTFLVGQPRPRDLVPGTHRAQRPCGTYQQPPGKLLVRDRDRSPPTSAVTGPISGSFQCLGGVGYGQIYDNYGSVGSVVTGGVVTVDTSFQDVLYDSSSLPFVFAATLTFEVYYAGTQPSYSYEIQPGQTAYAQDIFIITDLDTGQDILDTALTPLFLTNTSNTAISGSGSVPVNLYSTPITIRSGTSVDLAFTLINTADASCPNGPSATCYTTSDFLEPMTLAVLATYEGGIPVDLSVGDQYGNSFLVNPSATVTPATVTPEPSTLLSSLTGAAVLSLALARRSQRPGSEA